MKASGKQIYLGGYAQEVRSVRSCRLQPVAFGARASCVTPCAAPQEHAAEAFDVACLKAKGLKAKINNPVSKYADLLPYLESVTMEELVMAVRRQSQGRCAQDSALRLRKSAAGNGDVGTGGSGHG